MFELFKASYYCLDLLIGFASPLFFYFLYKTERIEKFIWNFFWVGCIVGLAWEIPIFFLSTDPNTSPVISWIRPLPFHYFLFMVCHCLWDGLIFVIGIWLIYRLCRKPVFEHFKWSELFIFLVWGQVSALLVELSSIFNDGWVYMEHWWNPSIFEFNGQKITILIQIIWVGASIGYYGLIVRYFKTTRHRNNLGH